MIIYVVFLSLIKLRSHFLVVNDSADKHDLIKPGIAGWSSLYHHVYIKARKKENVSLPLAHTYSVLWVGCDNESWRTLPQTARDRNTLNTVFTLSSDSSHHPQASVGSPGQPSLACMCANVA